jgi:creatinine amidohydrolase
MRAMPPFRSLFAFFLLLLGLAAQAHADVSRSVFLEELTWTELRDRVAAGATTVIVPVGGTEQSGPQIALGKHNARAHALAGRVATALGNVLVAPVIAYVPEGSIEPPAGHMRFPGTISVPAAAFETTLEYAARSLRHAGFRDIVLIGDHGGYQQSLVKVAAKLNREWAAGAARVHAVEEYYRAVDVDYVQALKQQGFRGDEIGSHAGLADTSLTLALAPQLVRSERLRSAAKLGVADGVHGDPRRSSAAAGQAGVDLIVRRTSDAIRKDVAHR